MIIERERPQRAKLVEERVKELLEQRELIDLEIELLRPGRTITASAPRSTDHAIWENSLAGFHNPQKHKGLTPTAFLERYKARIAAKPTSSHKAILAAIVADEQSILSFIRQRFSRTVSRESTG